MQVACRVPFRNNGIKECSSSGHMSFLIDYYIVPLYETYELHIKLDAGTIFNFLLLQHNIRKY